MIWAVSGITLGAIAAAAMIWHRMRQRGFGRWLVPYLLQTPKRRRPDSAQDIHLILCFADHFEPKSDRATPERADRRLDHWCREYPRQFAGFRDSDGRCPKHTFFYPIEEYEAAHVDALAGLCRAGFGEIEIHLHHDNDNARHLRRQLLDFKEKLGERHGLLARNAQTGEVSYGFIHGNWALCNSRPDRRLCGVNEELDVLRETGCYADFTMPSAPHATQTRKINSIYYAMNQPGVARSHDRGIDVGAGPQPTGSMLLIQGPLVFDWRQPKGGVVPRLENGCVQNSQPPSIGRVASWLRARVQVPSRPDWFFVKLHSHGAEESSHESLLGEPMVKFHRQLAEEARRNPRFHFHYVTAREMYNLIKAAEAGWSGPIADALDYELVWNGSLEHGHRASRDDGAMAVPGSKS
jgi:hypothetical protein